MSVLASCFDPSGVARRPRAATTLCWLTLAGCSTPAPLAPPSLAALFQDVGEVAIGSGGYAEPLEIALADVPSAVFLRVTPVGDPSPEACLQLDSVVHSESGLWVPPMTSADWGPYCTTCRQRVSIGHGYGLFGFPNDGASPPSGGSLIVRVAVRDCLTGQPLDPRFPSTVPPRCQVDLAQPSLFQPEVHAQLTLDLAIAGGTQFADQGPDDPILRMGVTAVQRRFGAAEIDVKIGQIWTFTGDADRVRYDRADHSRLAATVRLAEAARPDAGASGARSALVILTPCLEEANPLTGAINLADGLSPHLPGGLSRGASDDAIFVRAGGCRPGEPTSYWPSGELLGKVLAHELGHHLGLYHTEEADGRRDHLDDTDAENLMFFQPLQSTATGWSPKQVAIMRLHPLVTS